MTLLNSVVSETCHGEVEKSVGEQESSFRLTEKKAKDAQRGTTTNTAGTGEANSSSATLEHIRATGKSGLAKLNNKKKKQ